MRQVDHSDEPKRRKPDRPEATQPDSPANAASPSAVDPYPLPAAYPQPDPRIKAARRRRILAVASGTLAVVVALVMVSGSLYVYARYRAVWHSIKRQNVSRDLIHIAHAPPVDPKAENILLIGSDTRSGGNAAIGGSAANSAGQRSDTVMVLHLSPGAHTAVVLSFPRDSVVPVFSCTPEAGAPGQAFTPGAVEQINASFAHGGPGCLWKTIEQTTHIHINDFVQLTFLGFEKVIDDLGGVSVCLPQAVNDPQSNLNLSAGRHHVWGWQAMAFWRTREGLGTGMDTQRIQRDQFLMASLVQGVEHSGLLQSPTKIASVVSDLASNMTTDTQLTLSRMLSIARTLRGLRAGSVQFIEVPWVLYPANPNWVQWRQPQARRLFRAIAHDTRWPPVAPAQAAGTQLSTAGQAEQLQDAQATGSAGQTTSPAPTATPPSNLAKAYGGIRGNTRICRDQQAFSTTNVGHLSVGSNHRPAVAR